MENASKALLMAGGILIAIIILSLLVYTFTTTSRLAKTQDEKTLAEQTAAFNREYEAYKKTRMYGTDVITVVNKAIDYNQRLGTNEDKYKINIILNIKDNFDKTKQTINYYGNGTKKEEEPITISEGTLKGNNTYKLFEKENSSKMNEKLINFFHQKSEDEIKDINSNTKIKITSAITNFKTAIFQCTGVEYSEITGRIKSMTFQQL